MGKDKVKYKFQKNASEFENIKEIIDFLSSEKEIIIKANAYEYWDGYFQLNDDQKSDNIKHSSLYNESGDEIISVNEVNGKQEISGDYADGYDIKKQTYEDGYCIWANCQVEMDFLMDELNKYLSEDDDNAQNEIEYFYDYLELPQDSDEAIEFFDNGTDGDNGIGREESKKINARYQNKPKSFALRAIDNRFRILQKYSESKIGYSYIDLEGVEFKTVVNMRIPIAETTLPKS